MDVKTMAERGRRRAGRPRTGQGSKMTLSLPPAVKRWVEDEAEMIGSPPATYVKLMLTRAMRRRDPLEI